MAHKDLALPVLASSPGDINRLLRELETLNDHLMQLGLRAGGSEVKLPKTSRLLDELAEVNEMNLLQAEDRGDLIKFLTVVKKNAPVIHMSFGADPSAAFIEQLMVWLRREIHPLLLLNTGLQPNIGAGCILRTTNKYFDFSLKQNFMRKRGMLVERLTPKREAQA